MSPPDTNEPTYKLGDQIGRGGMADVFRARQTSLGRDVAVKRLFPNNEDDDSFKSRLLWEAKVLAQLDHPNIVPIYDFGQDDEGRWFYAMKEIRGLRWTEAIGNNSLDQNLEILLKVADAIAFAHSKGISHLDLKPSNVMLGEFGEVLVTDWGVAKTPSSPVEDRERGTPEYASPEIARGEFAQMGPHSDVYLLGALLFEIVTGKPPHQRHPDRRIPFFYAARNDISSSETDGELLDIALRSMRTMPTERVSGVGEFQKLIRAFQSHAESIVLAEHAQASLNEARRAGHYAAFQAAVFGFENAFDLWHENTAAQDGATAARLAYAGQALDNGDFDLGLSLLDSSDEHHAELAKRLREGRRDRQSQQQRLRTTRWAFAVAAIVSIIVLAAAVWTARDEARKRGIALVAKQDALRKEEAARKAAEADRTEKATALKVSNAARFASEVDTKLAEMAMQAATLQKKHAVDQSDKARKAKSDAREQAYFALIGSAESLIDENSFKRAKEQLRGAKLLEEDAADNVATLELKLGKIVSEAKQLIDLKTEIDEADKAKARDKVQRQERLLTTKSSESAASVPPRLRNWEWGRLSYLAYQANYSVSNERAAPVNVVAFTADGKEFLTGDKDGYVRWWKANSSGRPEVAKKIQVGGDVLCAAFLPMGMEPRIVIGTRMQDAFVQSWSTEMAGFTKDRFKQHKNDVVSIDVSRDGRWLLTSSLDRTVCVWSLESGQELHSFQAHRRYASKAVFDKSEPSDQIPRILTAGEDGGAIVWELRQVVANTGKKAWIARRKWEAFGNHYGSVYDAEFVPDEDRIITAGEDGRIVVWQLPIPTTPDETRPTAAIAQRELRGHTRAVRDITLASDNLLLSGGDDNTVRLWNLESAQQLRAFRGHSDIVNSVNLASPVGVGEVAGDPATSAAGNEDAGHHQWFASGSNDGTVKLWRLGAHREAHVFGGFMIRSHGQGLLTAAFSADGQRIVTAGLDRTGRIYRCDDLPNSAKIDGDIVTLAEGHEFPIRKVVFLEQRQETLTSSVDSTVRIWNEHGFEVATLAATGRAGALAATSAWIATGSNNLPLAQERRLFTDEKITSLLQGSEASIADNWGIRLWKVGDSYNGSQPDKVLKTLSEVTTLAFSPHGRQLISGHGSGRCMLWEINDSEQPRLLWGEDSEHRLSTGFVNHVAFLADGSVFSATVGGDAIVWDAKTGRKQRTLPLPAANLDQPEQLTSVSVSADGRRMAVSFTDGKLWLYDDRQGELLVSSAEKNSIGSVDLSPDGRWLVTTANGTGNPAVIVHDLGAMQNSPPAIDVSQSDSTSTAPLAGAFFESYSSGELRIVAIHGTSAQRWRYRAAKGAPLDLVPETPSDWQKATHIGPHSAITSACFSPGRKWFATAGFDERVKIWDPEGAVVAELEHPQPVHSVTFICSGERLQVLTACNDGIARLWDAGPSDGSTIQIAKTPVAEFSHGEDREGSKPMRVAMAFSQHGARYILTAGDDGKAFIWDADLKEQLCKFGVNAAEEAKPTAIVAAAVSPDGQYLVTGGGNNSARLWQLNWDVRNKQSNTSPLVTVNPLGDPMEHTQPVTSVAFSPDGKRVITGSEDTTAKIWDASTGRELLTLRGHAGTVTSVAFSPQWDGPLRFALTCSRDGAAILWPANAWNADDEQEQGNAEEAGEPDTVTDSQSSKSSSAATTSSID